VGAENRRIYKLFRLRNFSRNWFILSVCGALMSFSEVLFGDSNDRIAASLMALILTVLCVASISAWRYFQRRVAMLNEQGSVIGRRYLKSCRILWVFQSIAFYSAGLDVFFWGSVIGRKEGQVFGSPLLPAVMLLCISIVSVTCLIFYRRSLPDDYLG